MLVNKNQFEALVYQVTRKIKAVEGVESYILDTPCCFRYDDKNGHLHYTVEVNREIDLDRLADDGAMIPSDTYHQFMDSLLVDTEEVIKAVKLQRQPFIEYLERIENL